jgi:hypothetical protein
MTDYTDSKIKEPDPNYFKKILGMDAGDHDIHALNHQDFINAKDSLFIDDGEDEIDISDDDDEHEIEKDAGNGGPGAGGFGGFGGLGGIGGIDDGVQFVPMFKHGDEDQNVKKVSTMEELNEVSIDGVLEKSPEYIKLSHGVKEKMKFCEMCNKFHHPDMVAKWSQFSENGQPDNAYTGTCYHCYFFHWASKGKLIEVTNLPDKMSLVGYIIHCMSRHKPEECHVTTIFNSVCPICATRIGCMPEGLSDEDMGLLFDAHISLQEGEKQSQHTNDEESGDYSTYFGGSNVPAFDLEI